MNTTSAGVSPPGLDLRVADDRACQGQRRTTADDGDGDVRIAGDFHGVAGDRRPLFDHDGAPEGAVGERNRVCDDDPGHGDRRSLGSDDPDSRRRGNPHGLQAAEASGSHARDAEAVADDGQVGGEGCTDTGKGDRAAGRVRTRRHQGRLLDTSTDDGDPTGQEHRADVSPWRNRDDAAVQCDVDRLLDRRQGLLASTVTLRAPSRSDVDDRPCVIRRLPAEGAQVGPEVVARRTVDPLSHAIRLTRDGHRAGRAVLGEVGREAVGEGSDVGRSARIRRIVEQRRDGRPTGRARPVGVHRRSGAAHPTPLEVIPAGNDASGTGILGHSLRQLRLADAVDHAGRTAPVGATPGTAERITDCAAGRVADTTRPGAPRERGEHEPRQARTGAGARRSQDVPCVVVHDATLTLLPTPVEQENPRGAPGRETETRGAPSVGGYWQLARTAARAAF